MTIYSEELIEDFRTYVCLSTDPKPNSRSAWAPNSGDTLYEKDTSIEYVFVSDTWRLKTTSLEMFSKTSEVGNTLDLTREAVNTGRQICDWSVGAGGNARSSVDLWPVPGTLQTTIPQFTSSTGQTLADLGVDGVAITNLPSTFNTVSFWAKCNKRADGEKFSIAQINLSSDTAAVASGNSWVNKCANTFTMRADGHWRVYTVNVRTMGVGGTFVLGTSLINSIRMIEVGSNTAITFTSAPLVGAVAATLTVAFAGTTTTYRIRFGNGSMRSAQLTNGSTAVVWDSPLAINETTGAVYGGTAVRLGVQGSDACQFGPVYVGGASRGFAYVRLDDSTKDQIVARATLATPYTGLSGVTVPAGTPYSMLDLCDLYGLKASLFVLTKYMQSATKGSLTPADIATIERSGHRVCLQTHENPFDLNGAGTRLLGPVGYWLHDNVHKGIASVDTSANTITTVAAHRITQINEPTAGGWSGQGYSIEFYGTDLPSPLVINRVYWARSTTTTAFAVHQTEADAVNLINAIDLTTTGTPANFSFRYAGSAPDSSKILADLRRSQALLKEWGATGWQHLALNQGAFDHWVEEAVDTLMQSGELLSMALVVGGTGAAAVTFIPRYAGSHVGAAIAVANTAAVGQSLSDVNTFPVALQTDGASDITSAGTNIIGPYIDALAKQGAIASNVHHFLGNEIAYRNFLEYLDRVKYRVDQGMISTGTVIDAYAALVAAGVEPAHTSRQ